MNNTDRKIKQQEMIIDDNKTNHILHLILSLLTGGIWLIVWFFVALANEQRRSNASKLINKLVTDSTPYYGLDSAN